MDDYFSQRPNVHETGISLTYEESDVNKNDQELTSYEGTPQGKPKIRAFLQMVNTKHFEDACLISKANNFLEVLVEARLLKKVGMKIMLGDNSKDLLSDDYDNLNTQDVWERILDNSIGRSMLSEKVMSIVMHEKVYFTVSDEDPDYSVYCMFKFLGMVCEENPVLISEKSYYATLDSQAKNLLTKLDNKWRQAKVSDRKWRLQISAFNNYGNIYKINSDNQLIETRDIGSGAKIGKNV